MNHLLKEEMSILFSSIMVFQGSNVDLPKPEVTENTHKNFTPTSSLLIIFAVD
jgi:hypothetical protein